MAGMAVPVRSKCGAITRRRWSGFDGSGSGNVNAMDALASAYERGVGVTPDYDKALDWYRRAAQCGHNGALKRLRKLGELV